MAENSENAGTSDNNDLVPPEVNLRARGRGVGGIGGIGGVCVGPLDNKVMA